MVKIYRTTDRIPVKIGSITVDVSPLSFEQKADIQAMLMDNNPISIVKAAKQAVKYAVKGISGVKLSDGTNYELDFEGEVLSESCVDDLLNIDQDQKISLVCTTLLNGIPKEFVDPQTGKKIEGISIQRPKVANTKKK